MERAAICLLLLSVKLIHSEISTRILSSLELFQSLDHKVLDVMSESIIIAITKLMENNSHSISNINGWPIIFNLLEKCLLRYPNILTIEKVFNGRGYRPYVSSLKGHLGHTLGASAALELIVCLEMIRRGCLVPTKNLEHPDPKCGDINYLQEFKSVRPKLIMKDSFAFGGINSILLLRSYEDGNERNI